jgi:hypothetical protein
LMRWRGGGHEPNMGLQVWLMTSRHTDPDLEVDSQQKRPPTSASRSCASGGGGWASGGWEKGARTLRPRWGGRSCCRIRWRATCRGRPAAALLAHAKCRLHTDLHCTERRERERRCNKCKMMRGEQERPGIFQELLCHVSRVARAAQDEWTYSPWVR